MPLSIRVFTMDLQANHVDDTPVPVLLQLQLSGRKGCPATPTEAGHVDPTESP